MTEKQEKELKKAFTLENFKKLLYFVNACAGEGIQFGTRCADELLYLEILKEVSEENFDYTQFDEESYKFLGMEIN